MVEQGQMLEHAEVFGNLYGSPRAPVEAAMRDGRDTLFDVDWQGGQQIRASALGGHVVSIFVLPPSLPELERRLRARGQDSDGVIAGRMAKSRAEISHWAEYDYVLVNDDLDRTEHNLRAIQFPDHACSSIRSLTKRPRPPCRSRRRRSAVRMARRLCSVRSRS